DGARRAPVRVHDHHQRHRPGDCRACRRVGECLMAVTGAQPKLNLREAKGWRRTKNRIATVLMVTAFVLVLIPLVFVLITVITKGISIISWQFLTSPIPPQVVPANVVGIAPAVLGTIERTAL